VGTGNKGTVENRVGSGGGKQDAVKERDTVKERYLGRAYGRSLLCFLFSMSCGWEPQRQDALLAPDVRALAIP